MDYAGRGIERESERGGMGRDAPGSMLGAPIAIHPSRNTATSFPTISKLTTTNTDS